MWWREVEALVVQELFRLRIDRLAIEAGAREHELRLAERPADRFGHHAAARVVLVDEEHPEHLAPRVLDVLARAHVEHFLADALRLIGDALEAVHDGLKRGEGLERNALLRAQALELGVELEPQPIDLLLGVHRAPRERGVLAHERFHGAVEHRDGDAGDLAKALDRNGHVGRAKHEDLARHALGVVADALELRVDLDGDVREAQRPRDRLLAHDELEAEPVDFLLELVDALVANDDRVRELAILVSQGCQAAFERAAAQAAHLANLATDPIHVALKCLFEVCQTGGYFADQRVTVQ